MNDQQYEEWLERSRRLQVEQGDAAAIGELEVLIRGDDDPRLSTRLGLLLLGTREWERALQSFRVAERFRDGLSDPADKAVLLLGLAQSLANTGSPQEGLQYAREAAEMKLPTSHAAVTESSLLLRLGRIDAAIETLERARRVLGDDAELLVALAGAHQRRGDFDEAIRLCRSALSTKDDSANALGVLGESYRQLGQYPEALRALERAIDLDPRTPSHRRSAVEAALGLAQFPKARQLLEEGVQLHPREFAFHHRLADVLVGYGEVERAIAHATLATELSPNASQAWLSLAHALAAGGRAAEARAALQECLRHPPVPAFANDLAAELARE